MGLRAAVERWWVFQVTCSGLQEHPRRVETRTRDSDGLTPPRWQSVLNHDYQAWEAAAV